MIIKKDVPAVSVCMACYNAEAYLAEALNSLVQQTFTNWECIIVDDDSTDRSIERALSINDARIRVIKQDRHAHRI